MTNITKTNAKSRIGDVLEQNRKALLIFVKLQNFLTILRLLQAHFPNKKKNFHRFLSITRSQRGNRGNRFVFMLH